MRFKLKALLEIIDIEVEKAKRDAESTHASAVEITASARHSPSQSGDRVHATNQATITAQRYENLLMLQNELELASRETPDVATVPCLVRLKREMSYWTYILFQHQYLFGI